MKNNNIILFVAEILFQMLFEHLLFICENDAEWAVIGSIRLRSTQCARARMYNRKNENTRTLKLSRRTHVVHFEELIELCATRICSHRSRERSGFVPKSMS